MLSLARRIQGPQRFLKITAAQQLRHARTDASTDRSPRSRRRSSKFSPSAMLRKAEDKSEWWVVDGKNVPLRERFVIPRDNIPNKRRKQLREQFMRRTRLVLKESEHEPWCKRYMELYNELRENWQRLYWDDGYSKKLAQDHANYDSPDDDEEDFNPYRNRQLRSDQIKLQHQFVGRNKESDTWEKASQIRDKFEYDRERRMAEKGTFYHSSATGTDVLTYGGGAAASWLCEGSSFYVRLGLAGCQWQRYSTRSGKKNKAVSKVNAFSFIRSLLHQPRGPSHCWLNTTPGRDNMIKGDGIFLIIVVGYNGGSFKVNQNTTKMIEKAKSLQQRYPSLQVIAVQLCPSVCLDDISSHMRQIIKDYITFPILLSNNNILEEANVPCFFLSKGFQNPIMYPGKDVDLMVLQKAINDFSAENSKDANVVDVKSTWDKPIEVVKEPDACSASRNLLLSFPACISADACGNRLFLSDVNHHRIIMLNSDGKILDVIGSSPGFEDGDFEMAKLMRPAASFYDSSEDCLYFVDSENHAIRRADMEARVVETVFPVSGGSQKKGLWGWIVDKIWAKRSIKLKSEEYDPALLLFPWHLLKLSKNDIFVLNQSFGTLWIVDLESGLIREVIEDSSKILEICGQMILEKCDPLRQLPADWLEQQVDTNCSLEGIRYGGLMSSFASCQGDVVFYDEVGQRVVKFNEGSGSATTLCLSNFGNLGLPYWLTSSFEKMYSVDGQSEVDLDHSECFRLLPGRADIELIVDIPEHTDLVEQPQQGCIWCQARGAATEISGVERETALSQKVSSTQKFYDHLDNLIYATPEEESTTEAESQPPVEELQDGRVRIGCTVNTSPGTSEVVIYAALYLRLKKDSKSNSQGDSQEMKAARIADILEPKRKFKRDVVVKLLMMSERELEDVVFMRPLHVRIKFNCDLHPKGDNPKEIVVTDSTVEVRVTL